MNIDPFIPLVTSVVLWFLFPVYKGNLEQKAVIWLHTHQGDAQTDDSIKSLAVDCAIEANFLNAMVVAAFSVFPLLLDNANASSGAPKLTSSLIPYIIVFIVLFIVILRMLGWIIGLRGGDLATHANRWIPDHVPYLGRRWHPLNSQALDLTVFAVNVLLAVTILWAGG